MVGEIKGGQMAYASEKPGEPLPTDTPVQCTVCGLKFTQGARAVCPHCPLQHAGCCFVKCPNCGFDIPQKSRILEWLRKLVAVKK